MIMPARSIKRLLPNSRSDQDKFSWLEKGEIELAAHLQEFFGMLWQNTNEGFFADPIYGVIAISLVGS